MKLIKAFKKLFLMAMIFKIAKAIPKMLIDDELRQKNCHKRFFLGRVKTFQIRTSNIIQNTISHNLTAFDHFKINFCIKRSKRLIYAVLADENINYKSIFLLIGPRTENKIFFLKSLGFTKITAVDLISYSKLIT